MHAVETNPQTGGGDFQSHTKEKPIKTPVKLKSFFCKKVFGTAEPHHIRRIYDLNFNSKANPRTSINTVKLLVSRRSQLAPSSLI